MFWGFGVRQWRTRFVNLGSADLEWNARCGENFSTTRRSGSENEFHRRHVGIKTKKN
jgi:hypothetical protein